MSARVRFLSFIKVLSMPGSRRRRVLLVVAAVIAAGVVATAWTAYRAWTVQAALLDTVDAAERVRVAATSRDTDALPALVDELERVGGEADDRTHGPTWRLLGLLPYVGDDADAVAVVSRVVHDLSGGGLEAAVEAADGLGDLRPRDGRIDISALEQIAGPTSQAATSLTSAADRLAEVDTSRLVAPLRTPFRDLAGEIDEADRALSAADTALEVLPDLLGDDGERNYLLVFQNNAEVRATGGLPGSVALVSADDGALTLERQVAGNSFGRRETPVLPLTPGELNLYGVQFGTFFLNAGFSPDFSRASELWTARWQERFSGDVDGVLSLDTVALSYVVAALDQPVEVDGVVLDESSVVDELLHRTYLRLEEPAAQDRFFSAVSAAVFDRVRSGAFDVEDLFTGLARATREGRMLFAAQGRNSDLTAPLEGTRITGPDLASPLEPQFIVTFDDKGADKMTYFLRARTRLLPRYCVDGRQAFEMSMRLQSTAPADAASLPSYVTGPGSSNNEPGQVGVTVNVYAPPSAQIGDVRQSEEPVPTATQELQGYTVSSVDVRLDPGQVVDLSWRALGAPGERAAHELWVTPTLGSGELGTVPSAC